MTVPVKWLEESVSMKHTHYMKHPVLTPKTDLPGTLRHQRLSSTPRPFGCTCPPVLIPRACCSSLIRPPHALETLTHKGLMTDRLASQDHDMQQPWVTPINVQMATQGKREGGREELRERLRGARRSEHRGIWAKERDRQRRRQTEGGGPDTWPIFRLAPARVLLMRESPFVH